MDDHESLRRTKFEGAIYKGASYEASQQETYADCFSTHW